MSNLRNPNKKTKILQTVLIIFWAVFVLFGIYRVVERCCIYPLNYKNEIIESSVENGINKFLVFSVAKVESNFDKNTVSGRGAIGIMQITEKTAEYIALLMGVNDFDLFDAKTNINFGCFYLKYLFNKFENEKTAIAAYNAGEGNVRLWLTNLQYSDDGKTLKEIPFFETKNYVEKIYKTFAKYRNLYSYILDK